MYAQPSGTKLVTTVTRAIQGPKSDMPDFASTAEATADADTAKAASPASVCVAIDDRVGGAAANSSMPRSPENRLGDFISIDDCGAVPDAAMKLADVTIDAGSNILTVGSTTFAAPDIGKTISVLGAGAGDAALSGTIVGYMSPTQVVLSASAATRLSGVLVIVSWGTDNRVAIQAAIDANKRVFVPRGNYGIGGALVLPNVAGSGQLEGAGRDVSIITALTPMNEMVYKSGFTGYPRIEKLTLEGARLALRNVNFPVAHAVLLADNYLQNAATGGSNLCIGRPDKIGQSYEHRLVGNHLRNDSTLYNSLADLPLYNLEVYWSDNFFGQNVYINGSAANVYVDASGNFFTDDHPFGYPAGFIPPRNFWIKGGANSFLGCHADTSTEAGFFLDTGAHGSRLFGSIIQWLDPRFLPNINACQGIVIASGVQNAVVCGTHYKTNGIAIPAANLLVQQGTAHATTMVFANPGAVYSTEVRHGTGLNSFIIGEGSTASGRNSVIMGRRASDRGAPSRAFSLGGYSATIPGTQQIRETLANGRTTSTTPTRLWINQVNGDALNFMSSFGLNDGNAYLCRLSVIGICRATQDAVAWVASDVLMHRKAGAVTFLNSPPPIFAKIGSTTGGAGASIALTADSGRGSLDVTVAAPDSNTWDWVMSINALENV